MSYYNVSLVIYHKRYTHNTTFKCNFAINIAPLAKLRQQIHSFIMVLVLTFSLLVKYQNHQNSQETSDILDKHYPSKPKV